MTAIRCLADGTAGDLAQNPSDVSSPDLLIKLGTGLLARVQCTCNVSTLAMDPEGNTQSDADELTSIQEDNTSYFRRSFYF